MDADERVRRWAALNARSASELYQGTLGTEHGTRNWHYLACPDLTAEVIDMRESWYSDLTYEGWIIRIRVHCPHGQVGTSNGVVPLIPVEAHLKAYDLHDIFEDLARLDGHEEHTPS